MTIFVGRTLFQRRAVPNGTCTRVPVFILRSLKFRSKLRFQLPCSLQLLQPPVSYKLRTRNRQTMVDGVARDRIQATLLSFNSFNLKRGQKVGNAVLFNEESNPTKETVAGVFKNTVDISPADIAQIYGEPGKVNIYTGNTLYVGATHIEYDISFTWLSGAVV